MPRWWSKQHLLSVLSFPARPHNGDAAKQAIPENLVCELSHVLFALRSTECAKASLYQLIPTHTGS